MEGFEQFASFIADFPDILDQEFARRRDFSCVKMSSVGIERDVSFSEEDCLLQLETPHRYCTVPATKERKQGESGKWMFEVRSTCAVPPCSTVLLFDACLIDLVGDGRGVWRRRREFADRVGDPARRARCLQHCRVPRSCVNVAATRVLPFGAGVLLPHGDGAIDARPGPVAGRGRPQLRRHVAVGRRARDGHAARQRSVQVGRAMLPRGRRDRLHDRPGPRCAAPALLLQRRPRVARARNAPSSDGAGAKAANSNSIAVLNPAYCLVPVVSMYSSKRKPQTRVRFNFRGDFRFPVAGFDPFGAPL